MSVADDQPATQTYETRTVEVLIYEDGEEKEALNVTYFPGQPYTVKIDTPDGVDRQYEGRT